MKTALFFFIILCWFSFAGYAQVKVDKVVFEGLEKTKPSYLLHFIETKENTFLDSLRLQKDVQQLRNLRIFESVEALVRSEQAKTYVVFSIRETITTIPILNFGAVNDNFFVQLGLLNNNLWGKGHQYKVYYLYSEGHSFFFNHRTPFFKPHTRLGLATFFSHINMVEPAVFNSLREQPVLYDYTNTSANLTLLYQTSKFSNLEIGGGYLAENYSRQANQEGLLIDEIDRTGTLLKAIYTNDHQNFKGVRVAGWANSLFVETVFTNDDFGNFLKIFNEYKVYSTLGNKANLAFRLRMGIATNTNNPFAPFILDSYKNIRGAGNRVDRGTAEITLNGEYRYSIVQKKWCAIQLVAFADVGAWRKPGGTFQDLSKTMESFSGLGGRFYLPKWNHTVFRIDYGIDLNKPETQGFVIGLGQFF